MSALSAHSLSLIVILATLAIAESGPLVQMNQRGAFTIVLPPGATHPRRYSSSENTRLGKIKSESFVFFRDQNLAYTMVYHDYPDVEAVRKMDTTKALKAGRDAVMKKQAGKVEKQTFLRFQGLPALDYRFTGLRKGKPLYGRSLYVFQRNRLYQVDFASSVKADVDSPDVMRYFSSFQIDKNR